jgi:hypothetical protein
MIATNRIIETNLHDMLADFVWPTGEYKGTPIAEVPTMYLTSVEQDYGEDADMVRWDEKVLGILARLELERRDCPSDVDVAEAVHLMSLHDDSELHPLRMRIEHSHASDVTGQCESRSMVINIDVNRDSDNLPHLSQRELTLLLAKDLKVLRSKGITISEN